MHVQRVFHSSRMEKTVIMVRMLKYFRTELLCATIIHAPNPTFVLSLSEIGDLSCITSRLFLPGFLVDTL